VTAAGEHTGAVTCWDWPVLDGGQPELRVREQSKLTWSTEVGCFQGCSKAQLLQ
jgi:hypothetical protein